MRDLPLFIVDAFTRMHFRGNSAAVCFLEDDLPDEMMQAIAAEMNLSETAFVRSFDRPLEQATRFTLRWFSPKTEIPLCGHATLAASAVIFRELANPATRIEFDTKSGVLTAERRDPSIVLDFPAEDFRRASADSAVVAALGSPRFAAAYSARNGRNLLLHLSDEQELRGLVPDFSRLLEARGNREFLGVIVTAAGSDGYDFVSRYFAPWLGVNEDPVTGAAHCALAPYWASLTGKRELRAFQASRRGGEMTVRLKQERVELEGEAVIVAAGKLRLRTEGNGSRQKWKP